MEGGVDVVVLGGEDGEVFVLVLVAVHDHPDAEGREAGVDEGEVAVGILVAFEEFLDFEEHPAVAGGEAADALVVLCVEGGT